MIPLSYFETMLCYYTITNGSYNALFVTDIHIQTSYEYLALQTLLSLMVKERTMYTLSCFSQYNGDHTAYVLPKIVTFEYFA